MAERPPLLTVAPEGEVQSLEELVGIANAIEVEAVARYTQLARLMDQRGEHETAATFREMREIETRHVEAVEQWAAKLDQKIPVPERFTWRLPPEIAASWDEAQHSSLLTPYRALAIAVTNEERAFAHYAYLAAQASDPEVRRQAEAMAREELAHAAELRVKRRLAYHREHPAGGMPAPHKVETLSAFGMLQRQLEEAAAAHHERIATKLESIGDTASAALVADLARSEHRLADQDAPAFAVAARIREGAPGSSRALLRSALQPLERMSETYEDLIAHAGREDLLRAAQEALADVVHRLALIGARLEVLDAAADQVRHS